MPPGANEEVFNAVIVVSLVLLMLVFVILVVIINYQRKQKLHLREKDVMREEFSQQLLQAQIEVQENTYRHIAKELHDNVNQLLGTTKMLIGITELKLGQAPDTLATANDTLAKAIQELRLLSRSMDKDWLEQFDFTANLYDEVDRINSGQVVKAAIDGHIAVAMKPEEQILLFRIVQEAVQNAVRHAQPSRLNVAISNGRALEVKVINDGKPLPPDFQGMGTRNMKHRAGLFGGTVSWQSVAGETIVTICLPLNGAHENQSRPGGRPPAFSEIAKPDAGNIEGF